MKTQTVKQAIDFVFGDPAVQQHINTLEALPYRFVIYQIAAEVWNYKTNTIRVFLNFHEQGNPNGYKEDLVVTIQGTALTNFRILGYEAHQV